MFPREVAVLQFEDVAALWKTEELPHTCARAPMPVECRLSLGMFACHPRQAAGERRGEGEPELERRSAPSHLLELCVYRSIAQAIGPGRNCRLDEVVSR